MGEGVSGACLPLLVLGHGDDLALGEHVGLALAFAKVDGYALGSVAEGAVTARPDDLAAVALAQFDGGVVDGGDALLANRPPQRFHLRAAGQGGAARQGTSTEWLRELGQGPR